MNIELINTGSELMLGSVVNTHHAWISRQLARVGYFIARQTAVSDEGKIIQAVLRESLSRADLVITTGGLGPTSDDLTRTLIAELLGKQLHLDASVLAHIEGFFAARKRMMPASTKVQAFVPDGATVLPNAHGTAPGLLLEVAPGRFREASSFIIMLPGPPRELHPMFTAVVLPWIQKQFPSPSPFACRILKTTGLGESVVEEKIAPSLQRLMSAGLDVGYCARVGEVDIRLAARHPEADAVVKEACHIVGALLGSYIFSPNDEQIEAVVVHLLTQQQQTLALAESCTGGYIAHRLTNISGASEVLCSGVVTYSNEAKQSFLGVRSETLAAHGAVSEAVAREMAEGARQRMKTSFGLAVTGIAGPTGGTKEKPVGTVFVALAGPEETVVIQRFNPVDRETFKYVTSQQALELLRRTALGIPLAQT